MRRKEQTLRKTKIVKAWYLYPLNYMPKACKLKYLLWKSMFSKRVSEKNSEAHVVFSKGQKGVLLLPMSESEIILCIPLIEYLRKKAGREVSLKLVCVGTHNAVIQGFFSELTVWNPPVKNFFIDQKEFKNVIQEIQDFQPDYFINLDTSPSYVSWYVQLCSQAPIRMTLGPCPEPFANLSVLPGTMHNTFKIYQQITCFWDQGSSSMNIHELEIAPNSERKHEVQRELQQANLTSKKERVLFLWDSRPSLRKQQQTIVQNLLQSENWQPVIACTQEESRKHTIPSSLIATLPCFVGVTRGKLIALLSETPYVIGFCSPNLLLAYLCGNTTLGLFQEADRYLDISTLSQNGHIQYWEKDSITDVEAELDRIRKTT